MFNEIKFSEYVDSGRMIDKIDLPNFLKIYLNHRPPFGNTMDAIQRSFDILGHTNSNGQKVIRRDDFLRLLLTKGAHTQGCLVTSWGPSHWAEVSWGARPWRLGLGRTSA